MMSYFLQYSSKRITCISANIVVPLVLVHCTREAELLSILKSQDATCKARWLDI